MDAKTAMNTEQNQERWQVESGGEVFDTTFGEMTLWIDEGSLLRIDRVRKGNLRWIEAGKVPSLIEIFNSKDNGEPPQAPVVTLTRLGEPLARPVTKSNPPNFTHVMVGTAEDGQQVCSIHPDFPSSFVCGTCASQFCKTCPNSYGGSVKICPMCGAMCSPIAKVAEVKRVDAIYRAGVGGKFGFGDFGKALAYPFKFKTSLIMGGIMYMLFSIGQGATSFGGIYMLAGSLACFSMANTLTFGILAHTVENFSQGKIGDNFMPSFDDFSVWDDVIHPFFLSIGVYIVSFGPLIAVGLFAFFMVAGSVTKEMNPVQSDAARLVRPDLPYAANAVEQSKAVKELLNKQQNTQLNRIAAMDKGEDYDAEPPASAGGTNVASNSTTNPTTNSAPKVVDASEDNVMRAQAMIEQSQKAQAEAIVGKAPETRAAERAAMIKQVLGYGVLFLLLGGICLLWGLFYFPAACAVAGYTRSFAATLNPSVGFDTIKHLGVDYVKILLMGLIVAVISGFIGMILSGVFSAFDLPGMGNIPANAIGSLFGFYFSIVFACILGFALYKASDRLKLPS
ncbi:MAG: hypothetical protein ABIO36_02275 [Pyrinomonadaceae bacterium]